MTPGLEPGWRSYLLGDQPLSVCRFSATTPTMKSVRTGSAPVRFLRLPPGRSALVSADRERRASAEAFPRAA